MTTPERMRRRQFLLGWAVALIGVLLAVSTLYNDHQRTVDKDAFKACLVSQFGKLAESFTARSDINAKDSASTTNVIKTVASASSSEEVRAALDAFTREQDAIAKDRKDNPVPPFPAGRCE